MLWGENRGWKCRQLPGVKPRTPLAWAASALPLSHNSLTVVSCCRSVAEHWRLTWLSFCAWGEPWNEVMPYLVFACLCKQYSFELRHFIPVPAIHSSPCSVTRLEGANWRWHSSTWPPGQTMVFQSTLVQSSTTSVEWRAKWSLLEALHWCTAGQLGLEMVC